MLFTFFPEIKQSYFYFKEESKYCGYLEQVSICNKKSSNHRISLEYSKERNSKKKCKIFKKGKINKK